MIIWKIIKFQAQNTMCGSMRGFGHIEDVIDEITEEVASSGAEPWVVEYWDLTDMTPVGGVIAGIGWYHE